MRSTAQWTSLSGRAQRGVGFFEGLPEPLYARLVVACRDALILECPQEQAEEVTRFLEGIMVSGMDEVLNPGVTPADVQDRVGARCLLAGLKPLMPRLKKIWADGAYGSAPLAEWCQDEGDWGPEVVGRDKEASSFHVMKRWIVERTFSPCWRRFSGRLYVTMR